MSYLIQDGTWICTYVRSMQLNRGEGRINIGKVYDKYVFIVRITIFVIK
jgi:hypothetical protein